MQSAGPTMPRRLAWPAALLVPLPALYSCHLNQSAGLGDRIRAAAVATVATSKALTASSISASYSAPSRSASAAESCVVAPGGATAPSAVDKPSRSIASAPALPICQSSAAPAAACVPCGPKAKRPVMCSQFFRWVPDMARQLLGRHSASSRSVFVAGPCVVAPGGATAPTPIDEPLRSTASPAVALTDKLGDCACHCCSCGCSHYCSRCSPRCRFPLYLVVLSHAGRK